MSYSPTLTIPHLMSLWYEVISPLHHKDRDCHFYITKHFQYGGDSTRELTHYGYLLREINETFQTYDEAENRLREVLISGINEWLIVDDCDIPEARRNAILEEVEEK